MDIFIGIGYPTWWFLILGAAITAYTVLGGLGVGAIHLFFKGEQGAPHFNQFHGGWK